MIKDLSLLLQKDYRIEMATGIISSPLTVTLLSGPTVRVKNLQSVYDVGKMCSVLKVDGVYAVISVQSSRKRNSKTLYV